LFLGLTQEEAALMAKPASLGLWWLAQITGFELPGGAISAEIENAFTRKVPIPGAVLANFLACGEHHGVIVFFDLTLQLALRRLPEH
jgi:hypothetical protein